MTGEMYGTCGTCGNAIGECECEDNAFALAESAYAAHHNGHLQDKNYYEAQFQKYLERFGQVKLQEISARAKFKFEQSVKGKSSAGGC